MAWLASMGVVQASVGDIVGVACAGVKQAKQQHMQWQAEWLIPSGMCWTSMYSNPHWTAAAEMTVMVFM